LTLALMLQAATICKGLVEADKLCPDFAWFRKYRRWDLQRLEIVAKGDDEPLGLLPTVDAYV